MEEKTSKGPVVNIEEVMQALRATNPKKKPFVNKEQGIEKIGNNEPCYCNSGKKFKHCHKNKEEERELYNITKNQI
jgi:hypothetical protein